MLYCVLVACHPVCKPILQIFYLYTNASIRKKATHRRVVSSHAFVSHLANILPLYKRIHPEKKATHPSGKKATHPSKKSNASIRKKQRIHPKKATHPSGKIATHDVVNVIPCVCIFAHHSCKYFTKIQTHPSGKKQRLVNVIAFVCK